MAQQTIVTSPINSGLGDPAYSAFNKCNSNFGELYGLSATFVTLAQVEATLTLEYLGGTTAAAALSAAQAAITLESLGGTTLAAVESTITLTYLGGTTLLAAQEAISPGSPELYGAIGNGTTDDTAALVACLAAVNFIALTPGKNYLYSGLTISTPGASIYTLGGTDATATLTLKNGNGNVGLHFVDASGDTVHFDTEFIGRNFNLTCQAGSSQMIGIWLDNAELQYMDNVEINMSLNTYAGTELGVLTATVAMYGDFQQDGVFVKCFFTGGSGTHGDGVVLTGSISNNTRPNNNLFVGCRAQSCGGYGVHLTIGDGNVWLGGKIQANQGGGWAEDTDGLGNGPSNTLLQGMGFEANVGDDLYINISNLLRVRDVSFESSTATNHIHAPNYMTNAIFDSITSPAGKAATFAGNTGSGNVWKRNNSGFALTLPGGNVFEEQDGGYILLPYSSSISLDASAGKWFAIVADNATAFTINNPTNPSSGQEIFFQISNQSGGAMGTITWGSEFFLAGAFVNPANSNNRNIAFIWNAGNWQEFSRSPADIAG